MNGRAPGSGRRAADRLTPEHQTRALHHTGRLRISVVTLADVTIFQATIKCKFMKHLRRRAAARDADAAGIVM
jgi:hypothetical protein